MYLARPAMLVGYSNEDRPLPVERVGDQRCVSSKYSSMRSIPMTWGRTRPRSLRAGSAPASARGCQRPIAIVPLPPPLVIATVPALPPPARRHRRRALFEKCVLQLLGSMHGNAGFLGFGLENACA